MTYLRSFSDVNPELGVTALKAQQIRMENKGINYRDPMSCVFENMNVDSSRLFKSYLN